MMGKEKMLNQIKMQHRMSDGTVHPIQVGLRMVEEFRKRVKENIEANPLRAVAIVYEEELTRIKEQLGEGGDLEEFTALCPTLSACTMYIVQVFGYLCHLPVHLPNTCHSNCDRFRCQVFLAVPFNTFCHMRKSNKDLVW